MSTSTSSGISFSGLSSGIDTESIISRLVEIEQAPISRLQKQQAELIQKMSVMNQFKSKVISLSTAAGMIRQESSFQNYKATSSVPEVATVSVGSNASPGTYKLQVTKLAQAHKVVSSAQSSTTEALGLAPGTMVLNGRGISVEASDTLSSLAGKINQASAGVSATVINGGAGNAYLSLTSGKTGAASAIQLSDLSGNAASALGLVSGASAVREPIAGGMASAGFASDTEVMATMLGAGSVGPANLSLNGSTIEIDLGSMTLQDVAAAINASGSGALASVRSVTEDGKTIYKLDLTGVTSQSDPQNAMEALGLLQRGFTDTIVAAQDANYTVDGIALASKTNTLTDVLPGVTINLLKADETTITIASDSAATKGKITEFVTAFNNLAAYIRENSSFDPDTYASGPLLGNSTAQQVESQMAEMVLASVPGNGGSYTNLTQIGFKLDSKGEITLDEAMLESAMAKDPDSVAGLFLARGRTTSSTLAYISSNTSTRPSSTDGYAVEITQVATKAVATAVTALAGATTVSETLSFGGTLFGNANVDLALEPGMSLASIVSRINTDSRLNNLIEASDQGGRLTLTSKRYGTPAGFTVDSNLQAASTNSGIGSRYGNASVSQTLPTAAQETLTFQGAAFAGGPYSLVIEAGKTLDEVVSALNTDTTLSPVLTASNQGGFLRFESKTLAFTVASDVAAAADSTGVGTSAVSVGVRAELLAGLDVGGLIGGEAATGSGQFLTGNATNSLTPGLQVMYTGDASGTAGKLFFTKGVGALMNDLMGTFTDSTNGEFSTTNKALQDQADAIDERIADIQAIVNLHEQAMRQRFAKMEEAMATLSQQQTQLASMISGLVKS